MQRCVFRLGMGALAVSLVLASSPSPVAAHAELLNSSPGNRTVTGGDLGTVQLVFSEVVTGAEVLLLDPTGRSLPATVDSTSGSVISLLPDAFDPPVGTYEVIYRVVSADFDPIEGSFVFRYDPAAPEQSLRSGGPSDGRQDLLRVVAFVGFGAAAGVLVFDWRRRRSGSN